jgi:selenocysteine-specific elongation factor
VLDAHPVKHRRQRLEAAVALDRLDQGGLAEAIALELHNAAAPLPLGVLAQLLGEERGTLEGAVGGRFRVVSSGEEAWVYDDELLERFRQAVLPAVAAAHQRKPLLDTGLTVAELVAKADADRRLPDGLVAAMLKELEAAGHVRQVGNTFALASHQVALSHEQQALREAILAACADAPFAPPTVADLAKRLPHPSDAVAAMHEALVAAGELVAGDGFAFHPDALDAAWQRIEVHLRQHGRATVSELRELLDTSRRYALPLLQHFDRQGRLVRDGDYRRLSEAASNKTGDS